MFAIFIPARTRPQIFEHQSDCRIRMTSSRNVFGRVRAGTHNPLYSSKLLSVTSSFNLVQIVSELTRVTNNTCTLIDLIFVSSVNYVESCTTIPPLANSDHYGLHLKTNLKSPKQLEKGVPRKLWKISSRLR